VFARASGEWSHVQPQNSGVRSGWFGRSPFSFVIPAERSESRDDAGGIDSASKQSALEARSVLMEAERAL
jgi:hypothetical protein